MAPRTSKRTERGETRGSTLPNMTQPAADGPPPLRSKRPPRKPSEPRNGHASASAEANLQTLIITTVTEAVTAAVAPLQQRLDAIERVAPTSGASNFVEAEPEPRAMPSTAIEGDLTDWQRSLQERTSPLPEGPIRATQAYNYPMRRYVKHDGSVVQLQGDPQNRAYYRDKGLIELTPEQERHYLEVEYPQILERQREKADLINTIRRAGERYKDLHLEDTFDDYSIEEIREYLADIKRDTGKDIRVIRPRRQAVREAAEDARLMAGVDTTPPHSRVAEFEAEQDRARARRTGRQIEVTPQNFNQFR